MRKSICIVLSLRNGVNEEYRGINEKTLREDLAEINKVEDSPVIPETLYEYKDVKLRDFVKHLSNQDNPFKIQSYTLNQINQLFNNKLKQNTDLFVLTSYIKKTIEGWIEDGTLKFSPDGYLLSRTLSDNDLQILMKWINTTTQYLKHTMKNGKDCWKVLQLSETD